MTSPELLQVIGTVRSLLAQEPSADPDWPMMNSMPGPAGRRIPEDAPAGYRDLLREADGLICGWVIVFDARSVDRMQFYADPNADAPVALDHENWFAFGKFNDDPLFVRRDDGTVWGFPDTGVMWWQNETLENFAKDLDGFLLEYAFGPRYQELTKAPDDDQWLRLLRHIGRVG